MTRQRLWQLRKRSAGLCEQCGKRPCAPRTWCNHCAARARKARGCRARNERWIGVDALLGVCTDAALAEIVGIPKNSICRRRIGLGVKAYRKRNLAR